MTGTTQTPNSNLNLFTFTFHFNPTNAQQMHFSPVNKTVCPLEYTALTSIGHTVRLSLHARIIVVVVDLLPSFWVVAHGCKTGIELVLT
jgi:hypothetical protein